MAHTVILIDGEKKKKKKGKNKNRTQSVDQTTTEDVPMTKVRKHKTRGNNKFNKTLDSRTQDPTITEGEGQDKRQKTIPKIKVRRSVEVATKKIVHDPKLIGALPSLPLFYQQIVCPVRDRHQYNEITKTVGWDFTELLVKPTVLVLGSSEAGKTSLINYLLRDKKGYESHYDTVKDYKSSFTHITYDDNPSLLRGADAVASKSWAFNEITKYNKQKNDCQIQLFQIKNDLLQEITFIDSPPVTDAMLTNLNHETSGYYPILYNLIRKVDLIFFVGTPSIVDTSMNKVISLLNPYNYKTVFCLNKSDQYQNLTNLSNDRKNFSNYITSSISNGEAKVICTYFKGLLPSDEMKDFIHNDMETLLLKIKKLPSQYKTPRLISLNIHMMEIMYIALLHSEMRKKDKRVQSKVLSSEEIGEVSKSLNDLPAYESFLKNFPTLPEDVLNACDRVKVKPAKFDDIDALKSFLKNDFPYIQKIASEEPENVVKFLLPLSDPNKDPEPPKKEKKKVIKEIKIAIPNDDDGEEDDDDDSNTKKGNNDPEKKEKKQKFVNINKTLIENIMKDDKQ
uniref:G domain-containing protein n=1 Tax=Strongyloides papillosus TaxID=174720 RepID=A0A0N5BM55_STREA